MSLDRFIEAQDRIWPAPLDELKGGRKMTHWMWFVFPQLASLGRSGTAKFYGIRDRAEAADYLAHPVLGPRLRAVAGAMLTHAGETAETILGPADALKLRSSMTLFEVVADERGLFGKVLDTFCARQRCPLTLGEIGS